MSDSGPRPQHGDAETPVGDLDPAAVVANTLRELGPQLDQWAIADEVPPGAAPFAGSAQGADGANDGEGALLASLGIDAVINTNATVYQRSLREFLR